jgi:hypothetical protein
MLNNVSELFFCNFPDGKFSGKVCVYLPPRELGERLDDGIFHDPAQLAARNRFMRLH